MDVSVSGTINQKKYLKKFRGASAPLTSPGSACVYMLNANSNGLFMHFLTQITN